MSRKKTTFSTIDKPVYQLNQVGNISTSFFHKLIDEVTGKPFIAITGGEPLLNPDAANFFAYAKKNDMLC